MRDFDIESDLKQEKFQNIKLVQGDRGNKIKINIYEDGQPVNLAGCSITAKYKRNDGEIVNGTVENISGNSFDAVMDSDITKASGTLKMIFTIEKDDVKVSTFLLLADVREGIGENTGSSGGSTGGGSGEVTIDLSNYYKKIETYSKNQIDARFKDIEKQIENIGGFDTSKFMYVTEEVDESIACTGITLNANTLTFTGGDTQTLTVTKIPSNTTDKITYTTNPTGIVVVNNGVITPIKNGATVITVTCGSKTATCNVTVTGISTTVAVQSVSLNKNTTTINVGKTETLVATISPTNATNQNITWGTDAPNVATVTNGVVEGKSVGTASISVETEDGSKTATCNVTVQQASTSVVKNIFDKDTMIDTTKGISTSGEIITTSNFGLATIPVKANTTYSIKRLETVASGADNYLYNAVNVGAIGFADSDKTILSHLALDDSDLQNYSVTNSDGKIEWIKITTPSNCSYLMFNTNLRTTADKIQVEEGDTIHNYYTAYKGGND